MTSRAPVGPVKAEASDVGSLMFSRTINFEFLSHRGRLDVEMDEPGDGLARLVSVRSTGHRIDLEEQNLATLIIPRSGEISVRSGSSELSASVGEALLFPPNRRDTRVEPGPNGVYAASVVQVSLDLLGHWRGHSDFARRLELGSGLTIKRGAAGLLAIGEFTSRIFALDAKDGEGAPKAANASEIVTELLDDLMSGVATEWSERPKRSALRLVRKAEEMMHDRRADPLSISELAQELNVSPRTMQIAFRHSRGVTAREALTRIRLEAVRAQLLASNGEVRISDVALDEGFTHLGRFSGLYRKTYGETPKATLKSRTRPPAGKRAYTQFS